MRRELEILAGELRANNLRFKDSNFEEFLWKYAAATMRYEGIKVTGKETGYMYVLMKQKAKEMIDKSSLLVYQKNLDMGKFAEAYQIEDMVRREHGEHLEQSP